LGSSRTACRTGAGRPRRRHIAAKSSSPSDCVPPRMAVTSSGMRARRWRWVTTSAASLSWVADNSRC
jgi:hypothetical protein